jgi:hypothetical protein
MLYAGPQTDILLSCMHSIPADSCVSLTACMVRADTSLFIVGIAAMSYYGERHIAPGFQLVPLDSSCVLQQGG